jgi:hypothetical protein
MGRIDGDKMYDVVMKWDWGNSGDPSIYHDVETRRNGITYRSNLARLADQLIKEGKYDKAEDIFDLAMEKMPVEKFELYWDTTISKNAIKQEMYFKRLPNNIRNTYCIIVDWELNIRIPSSTRSTVILVDIVP